MRKALALILVIYMFGCAAPIRVVASKHEMVDYPEFDSLLFVHLGHKLGRTDQIVKDKNLGKIGDIFLRNGIKTEIVRFAYKDLDSQKKIDEALKRYRYVVYLDPIAKTTGHQIDVTYDVKLIDQDGPKAIWVLRLVSSTTWTTVAYEQYDLIGEAIYSQMLKDAVI